MIHPETARRQNELATAWQERPSLRIERFLRDDIAGELLESLRQLPHVIKTPSAPGLRFLYYELALEPETACDHVTCRFARWFFDEGRAWLAELTGLRLHPPADGRIVATAYSKGSYLDAHNDTDGARVVAYVLGLTRSSWPPEHGGHLEFLETGDADREPRVIERRAPGWNSLDLFDVRQRGQIHQIPILTERHERRAFSGWFYRR